MEFWFGLLLGVVLTSIGWIGLIAAAAASYGKRRRQVEGTSVAEGE